MIYFDGLKFNNEVKYEVYLLNKYLTMHYGSDTAIKLLKQYNSCLDDLARALGKIDTAFFSLYFMKDKFVVMDGNTARELSNGHYELWKISDDLFSNDKYDKACIIEPRGFAKTTIMDMAVCVRNHCYKFSIYTLLGAKTDTDATQFLDSIKKVFNNNEKIIKVFGKLIDFRATKENGERYTINANEVEFTNGTYIKTVGSGTSVRGSNWCGIRPTVFIGDDFQDEKNILTDVSRDKQYNKWTKEIEEVGDKAVYRNGKKIKTSTKIIAIGTVLHVDCLMSRLSRNNDYHTILRRAIILEDGQTVEDILESDLWKQCHDIYFDNKLEKDERKDKAKKFYEDHKEEMQFKTWWPEKWDCFTDLAIKYWENRAAFMSELMNDASSIGEKWFKSCRSMISEEIEEHTFNKTMISVDPASTTNKKSDSTSIIVGSDTSNGFTYVRDIVHKKLSFDDYCQTVVNKLLEFEDATHVNIEKNTFQGADVIKIKELIGNIPKLQRRRIEFINEMQRRNKDEKISTIIDPVNNGEIIIVSDKEDSSKAIKELKDFQGQLYSLHDDFPDNLSELHNKLKTIVKLPKITLYDRNILFD